MCQIWFLSNILLKLYYNILYDNIVNILFNTQYSCLMLTNKVAFTALYNYDTDLSITELHIGYFFIPVTRLKPMA